MADTLGRGFDRMGQSDINRARMDLLTKQTDYNLERTRAQDERTRALDALQRPGLERAAQQDRQALAADNEPLRFSDFAGDEYKQLHLLYGADKPEGMAGTLWGKTEALFGGKLDTTPGSKTYGQLLRPDGTPITRGEAKNSGKLQQWGGMVMAHTDIFKNLRDQQSRILDEVRAGTQDGTLTKERAAQLKGSLERINEISSNPSVALPNLEQQYQVAVSIGDEKNMTRIQGQMDAIRKAQAEEAKDKRKFAHETELERYKQGEATKRTQITAGKEKAGFEGGEWVSPKREKLSTDDAFTRYSKSVPKVYDEDTDTESPTMSFEDWAQENGYTFVPKGTSPAERRVRTGRGARGKGTVRGKVGDSESARAQEQQPPVQGARLAPDGNWYVPDPNRPGKYLQVQ